MSWNRKKPISFNHVRATSNCKLFPFKLKRTGFPNTHSLASFFFLFAALIFSWQPTSPCESSFSWPAFGPSITSCCSVFQSLVTQSHGDVACPLGLGNHRRLFLSWLINLDWFVRNRKEKTEVTHRWNVAKLRDESIRKKHFRIKAVYQRNDTKLIISSNVDYTSGRQLHPIIWQNKFKPLGTFPRDWPKFACSTTLILCKSEFVFFVASVRCDSERFLQFLVASSIRKSS